MKKLFLLAGLLLAPLGSHAAITVTQRCSASDTTNSATVSCSFTGSTTAGSTIVVITRRDITTQTLSSVSDGGTNTFVSTPGSPCTETTTARRVYNTYAKNSTSVTNPTYTATWSGTGTTGRDIEVVEINGVSATSPFDKETCASSETTSVPDPGSVALSFNNEAIIEYTACAASCTVGSTFTELVHFANGNEAQQKVVTNGTWTPSAFATSNANWIATGVTFTDAAGGSGPAHQLTTLGCCGVALRIDDTNLFAFPECAPQDASCAQGISVCVSDPSDGADRCFDLSAGGSPVQVKLWKQTATQRLTSPIGALAAIGSGRGAFFLTQPGPPLP